MALHDCALGIPPVSLSPSLEKCPVTDIPSSLCYNTITHTAKDMFGDNTMKKYSLVPRLIVFRRSKACMGDLHICSM